MTEYTRINRQFENLFFRRVKKTIDLKVNSLISVIQESGIERGRIWIGDQLVNPDLVKEIQRLYAVVGVRHANRMTRKLRAVRGWRPLKKSFEVKGFGFNEEWVRFIEEYLRLHLIEKITFDVNATTRAFLLRVLQNAIRDGLGVDETVRNLRESGFSDIQAARIVRTEVNTAANTGVIAAGQTYEYQMLKEWVSIHDRRTRGNDPEDHANHVSLNGTVIDFEDLFTDPRNGGRLNHPGDPRASAASIINCRCNLTLKAKRDRNDRLIPKRKTTTVIYPNPNRQRIITI
jgi:F like protein